MTKNRLFKNGHYTIERGLDWPYPFVIYSNGDWLFSKCPMITSDPDGPTAPEPEPVAEERRRLIRLVARANWGMYPWRHPKTARLARAAGKLLDALDDGINGPALGAAMDDLRLALDGLKKAQRIDIQRI